MPCTEHDHAVPPAVPTFEEQNLIQYIDKKSFKVLNGVFKPVGASKEESVDNILIDTSGAKYLESDCDCQLLIEVHFLQPVKLYSILIDTKDSESTIKHIHLYKNIKNNDHGNLNFDKIQNTKFDFSLECRAQTLDETFEEYHLPRPNFKNVKSLVLFIPDNIQDDEDLITKINHLQFRGDPMDSSQYQSQEFTLKGQIFESAPNLSDHVKVDEGTNSMVL